MKNLDRIRKELTPSRRRKIADRAAEIMAEEMTLRQMRLALRRTQAKLGEILGIGQHGVCRLEQRSDLLLSTLRGYVEAMGGHLNIVVEFPDHEPVLLGGIAGLEAGSRKTSAETPLLRAAQIIRKRTHREDETRRQVVRCLSLSAKKTGVIRTASNR